MEEKDNLQLPENAFRELKDGEEYKPLMSPDKVYPEVNGWSVTWGIVMAVIPQIRNRPHKMTQRSKR